MNKWNDNNLHYFRQLEKSKVFIIKVLYLMLILNCDLASMALFIRFYSKDQNLYVRPVAKADGQ